MMRPVLCLALLASSTLFMAVSSLDLAASPTKKAPSSTLAPKPTPPPYFVPAHKAGVNWHGAMIECLKRRMVLTRVPSLSTYKKIRSRMPWGREYWVGANDLHMKDQKKPGQYQWIDGVKVNMTDSSYWMVGEDEHSRNLVRPHCVYVSEENSLALGNCASERSFMCEVL